MFYDYQVVIDGALDAHDLVFSDDDVERIAVDLKKWSIENPGRDVALYVLKHDHEPHGDDEDTCFQYVTDHRPFWSSDGNHQNA